MKKSILSLLLASSTLVGCASEVVTTSPPQNNSVTSSTNNSQSSNSDTNTNQTKTSDDNTKSDVPVIAPTTSKKISIADSYNTETVLVGLKSAADLSKVDAIAKKYNVKINSVIKGINTVILSTNGQNVPELLNKLATEDLFTYVETDNIGTNNLQQETEISEGSFFGILDTISVSIINDKYYKDQYNLKLTKAIDAWTLSKGKDQIVAVIDSGVDTNHEDLKNKLVAGYNAFTKKEEKGNVSALSYFSDTYKHGSHLAGIIAAETNNLKGIAGVAPDAKIMPINIMPGATDYIKSFFKKPASGESLKTTSASSIADGIVWAVDHKASVILLSMYLDNPSTTTAKAIQYAIDSKISVVVSAGNDKKATGRNAIAKLPNVISVGATDKDNKLAAFSKNVGNIAAPGVDIISTNPSILNLKNYKKMSGTEMSAAQVAGVVAQLKDKFGDIVATPQWIKDRLIKTSTAFGNRTVKPAIDDPAFVCNAEEMAVLDENITNKDEIIEKYPEATYNGTTECVTSSEGYNLLNALKALEDPI